MKPQDIGLIGLAVMGQNLFLNMERNGFGAHTYRRVDREGVFHTKWTT